MLTNDLLDTLQAKTEDHIHGLPEKDRTRIRLASLRVAVDGLATYSGGLFDFSDELQFAAAKAGLEAD